MPASRRQRMWRINIEGKKKGIDLYDEDISDTHILSSDRNISA